MTLSIEILPIVFLKNNSSIVWDETVLSEGNNKSNFPNLNGWVGYAVASYLLNVNWVWSWKAIILCKSFNVNIDESNEDEDDDEDDDDDEQLSLFSCLLGKASNIRNSYFNNLIVIILLFN